ncbi:hypothetical protein [Paenibacillus sp. MCAF9]|uniref:hypothetical protein n=1 Tax=Paenibacillus sp. MCAF9 TaxID=3233046 RepID=UPI003F963837
MTAIIAFSNTNGVFIAADSRRTDLTTGTISSVKKVHKLNEHVFAFTAGLGDYGDFARNELKKKLTADQYIYDIIELAKPIFKSVYARSLQDHPNHTQRLLLGLVGVNPNSGAGKILFIQDNVDNYQTIVEKEPNLPFFMSTQSEVFTLDGMRIFNELIKDGQIQMDTFAYTAIQQATTKERMVGFPIQLVLIKSGEPANEKYPVDVDGYTSDPFFKLSL